ncbi:MAG: hypothetical protein K2P58_01150 [Hyphomonadaceae bacterium]|nr:hypothetical protein [Hyphomonadaceae bacterium]
MKKRDLWHYAIVGALAGCITVVALSAGDMRSYVELIPIALVVGVANAMIFWLIRRPDRDAPNPPTSPP